MKVPIWDDPDTATPSCLVAQFVRPRPRMVSLLVITSQQIRARVAWRAGSATRGTSHQEVGCKQARPTSRRRRARSLLRGQTMVLGPTSTLRVLARTLFCSAAALLVLGSYAGCS